LRCAWVPVLVAFATVVAGMQPARPQITNRTIARRLLWIAEIAGTIHHGHHLEVFLQDIQRFVRKLYLLSLFY
jgi:hypothetical protein